MVPDYLAWLDSSGPLSSVVVSSRVRLARNLIDLPFPAAATRAHQEAVQERVKAAMEREMDTFGAFHTWILDDVAPLEREILVEQHQISPLQASPRLSRTACIAPGGTRSVMVNEEDHLRLQSIVSGLDLAKALALVNAMDDALERHLEFAWSESIGYLTSCLTNVGTAMRASVMIHLPGLQLSRGIDAIRHSVAQMGLVVRGLYGEGTNAQGNLFQISNPLSLGPEEDEIASHIRGIVEQIGEQELAARQALKRDFEVQLRDRVSRALGVLRHAWSINSAEALELLSLVRLGLDLELLPPASQADMNYLLVAIRPAMLQQLLEAEAPPEERDVQRARLLRDRLKGQASS